MSKTMCWKRFVVDIEIGAMALKTFDFFDTQVTTKLERKKLI